MKQINESEMLHRTAAYCSIAERCIQDIEKKIYYINRTTDIFTELLNTLDYERGGDVAVYLTGLYTHQIKLLTQANVTNDTAKVDIVMNVAKGLLEAWREVNAEELMR